jgi:DnaJ family protein A protein 2
MSSIDPFKILNIPHDATIEQIKTAYKKQALIHHPDRGGNSQDFNNINTAYENIIKMKESSGQQFFPQGFNLGNIISQFVFRKNKCQPILYNHKVTLEDICKRKILKLKVSLTKFCDCMNTKFVICNTCKGEGYIISHNQTGFLTFQSRQECSSCLTEGKIYNGCENCEKGIFLYDKIFELYLNPEIWDGYNYIFKDTGNQSKGMYQGDFVVTIKYLNHPVFKFENKDLFLSKDISLKESLCGYEFVLQHPNGENIEIKSNLITKPEMFLKINSKGISQEGNLIIKFNIVFPDNLKDEQKEILKSIL